MNYIHRKVETSKGALAFLTEDDAPIKEVIERYSRERLDGSGVGE
jgi:hypothetical protein